MTEQMHTIVVGAGIAGICCALALREKGLAVTLVDRDPPATGTSTGNAGVISPWSNVPMCVPGVWRNLPKWLLYRDSPVTVRPGHLWRSLPWAWRFFAGATAAKATAISDGMAALNGPSIDIYRHYLRGTGHEDLIRPSIALQVYRDKSKATLDGFAGQLRARHGTPMEVIGAERLREIEPALSTEFQAAVVLKDQARTLLPGRLGAVLAEKFQAMGGVFHQATAHALTPIEGGGWRLTTDRGEMVADKMVLAAGAWSAGLLRPLGIDLPLETERGYHLTFKNPGVTLNNSVLETDAMFISSSMENGIRSAGTAELGGLDTPPNYHRAQILKGVTKRMIPDLNTDDVVEWMGNRPSLPDHLPCIDEMPGHPGLFGAFGHAHWGMSMSPNTGRIIADLVSGTQPNIDLSPYRADRFG